jgi:D-alanyl-D-alanine dipeptidase
MNKIRLIIAMMVILGACKNEPKEAARQMEEQPVSMLKTIEVQDKPTSSKAPDGWQELTDDLPGYVTDIKYATTDNFVKEVMYDCGKCFLRNQAAEALDNVAKELTKRNLKIKLFDCYRPGPVQQKLWEKVPDASYVTPPWRGSQHNRGVAVDLTIIDANGKELDMGTAFDYFGEEAHHTYTAHSEEIQQNRTLLKSLMEQYGFASIRTEWWHYSIAELKHLEVSQWEWDCN